MENSESGKLGTAFHESFALSRPALRQIVKVVGSHCGAKSDKLTYDRFREATTLGSNYIKAMRRYCRGCGLVDLSEQPTRFGSLVFTRDPDLTGTSTQWLLHYHMSAQYHAGPGFWQALVENALSNRASVTSEDLASEIADYLAKNGDRPLAERTLQSTAGVFAGTYTKPDSLGGLGILTEDRGAANGTKNFLVGMDLRVPPVSVVAYVITDYWDHAWPGRTSVNLGWLSDPGGPGSLLLMNSGEIGDVLKEMQTAGLVELQRRVAPYQVFRLWKDTSELLERIYD